MRRQLSQSFGDGFASNASVTAATAVARFAVAGHAGSSTPGVSGPPGLCARRRCCSVNTGAMADGPCASAVDIASSVASALATQSPEKAGIVALFTSAPPRLSYGIGSSGSQSGGNC